MFVAEAARPAPAILLFGSLAGFVVALWRRALVVLLAVALMLGCALAGLRLARLEHAALARGAAHNADALLEGEIIGDPVLDAASVRFTLAVARAEIDRVPLRLRERAWVTVRPPIPVDAGDIVRVDGRLRPVTFADMDAAGRAAAKRLTYEGIAARVFASAQGVEITGRTQRLLARIAEKGRAAVRAAGASLPPRERGLLLGITIGDTSGLDPADDLDFRTTGLSHIVAVSGANLAYVLALVAFALRAMRARRRTTVVVMAVSVVSFMAIARFEPSVMRAGVMTGIALGGVALGARRTATTTLAAAILVLLVADPFIVHAPGFQLSALATAGILVLTPRIIERLPKGKLSTAAAVTLGAQLAVAPLIALRFGQVSLVALAANIAVVPMVAPATVLGMIAALAGLLWAPLSSLAIVARAPIDWMLWVAHVLAQLPLASIRTPVGIGAWPGAVVLGLLAVRVARRRPSRARASRRPLAFVMAIAVVVTGGVWARALSPPPLAGLVVTMIDVGQGEAVLVEAGGRAMLIDGGPDDRVLLRALAAHAVHRLDLLVLTHPHADHVDGLAALVNRFPVARALDPYIAAPLRSYRHLTSTLARRGIPRDRARAGMSYRLGPAVIEVLWPPEVHMTGTAEDVNNNSIVLRARYGAQSVLFAGETQEEAQQALLEHPELLRADVLKVSHHGSRHMEPAFYAASGARVSLIPVGPNTFGHPAPATLLALEGTRVFRSDLNGKVSVALDGGGGLDLRTER